MTHAGHNAVLSDLRRRIVALDRAAREAAVKWHFRPGTRDGIPVPTTVPYTMVFQLGG